MRRPAAQPRPRIPTRPSAGPERPTRPTCRRRQRQNGSGRRPHSPARRLQREASRRDRTTSQPPDSWIRAPTRASHRERADASIPRRSSATPTRAAIAGHSDRELAQRRELRLAATPTVDRPVAPIARLDTTSHTASTSRRQSAAARASRQQLFVDRRVDAPQRRQEVVAHAIPEERGDAFVGSSTHSSPRARRVRPRCAAGAAPSSGRATSLGARARPVPRATRAAQLAHQHRLDLIVGGVRRGDPCAARPPRRARRKRQRASRNAASRRRLDPARHGRRRIRCHDRRGAPPTSAQPPRRARPGAVVERRDGETRSRRTPRRRRRAAPSSRARRTRRARPRSSRGASDASDRAKNRSPTSARRHVRKDSPRTAPLSRTRALEASHWHWLYFLVASFTRLRSTHFGNSWSARHSLGRPWPRLLLHRADLAQHAARLLPHAAVHHPGDVGDGSARQGRAGRVGR